MPSSSKSKVCFFFETNVSLQYRNKLKKFIEAIFRREKKELRSLNYIFCSDRKLLEINSRYLNHDYYTDIITFELSGKKDLVEGEIYISIDRVRDNAHVLGIPIYKELHRVIFHGVLHLCGYKDKRKKEMENMRGKEEFFLTGYFK